jgi:hypothetical protein
MWVCVSRGEGGTHLQVAPQGQYAAGQYRDGEQACCWCRCWWQQRCTWWGVVVGAAQAAAGAGGRGGGWLGLMVVAGGKGRWRWWWWRRLSVLGAWHTLLPEDLMTATAPPSRITSAMALGTASMPAAATAARFRNPKLEQGGGPHASHAQRGLLRTLYLIHHTHARCPVTLSAARSASALSFNLQFWCAWLYPQEASSYQRHGLAPSHVLPRVGGRST